MNQVATTNQQQSVAVRANEFKQELVLAKPTIEKMLPNGLTFEKFEGMVVNVVVNNQKLLGCTQSSLLRAVIDSADVGLSLNPVMREADILPVWGKNGTVAQFRPRAIGYMKLARQTGEIVSIAAHEVYENDFFEYEYGMEEKLVHRPLKTGNRGAITHGYCVWKLKDGTKQFEVVDRARIDRSRGASEGYKYAVQEGKTNSVWHLHEGEMVRKTAVRAASKYFPMSTESDAFLRAMRNEDSIDGEFTNVGDDVVDPMQEISHDEPASGAAQVKGLEAKLGVGEQKGAQPAAVSQAPANSASSPAPSATSPQANSPSGGATTASRSRKRAAAPQATQDGPPAGNEPPPPNSEEDYGRSSPGPQQAKAAQAPPPAETVIEEDPTDWAIVARDMRKQLLNVGRDLGAWKKFMDGSRAVREKMKIEAPAWHARISAEILGKEEWLREQ